MLETRKRNEGGCYGLTNRHNQNCLCQAALWSCTWPLHRSSEAISFQTLLLLGLWWSQKKAVEKAFHGAPLRNGKNRKAHQQVDLKCGTLQSQVDRHFRMDIAEGLSDAFIYKN